MKTQFLKTPDNIRKGVKCFGLFSLMLTALFLFIGGDSASGMTMAAAGGLVAPTETASVAGGPGLNGGELTTEDAKKLSPNLLEDSVSERVTEVYSETAPLYFFMNKLSKVKMDTKHGNFSRVHRFYQIDERPVSCTVLTGHTANTSDLSAELSVDNIKMWTKDCIIVPKFATTPTPEQSGWNYESGGAVQTGDLQLIVVDVNRGASKIIVQAINAKRNTPSQEETSYLPTIPDGTELVRLAMLGSETDAQAPSYEDLPKDSANYVATFHTQYEVTPDFLKHGKEINWGVTQIKDRTMRDFYNQIELTLLAGQMATFQDVKDNDRKYQMGGFLYYNNNTFDYDYDKTLKTGLTAEVFNNLMKEVFSGNNGSRTRLLLMGSEFARQAQSIKDTEKFSTVMTPKVKFGFEFTGISNLFGTLDAMLYTKLDQLGMEDYAIVIDLANVGLVEAEGLSVTPLDLIKSGQKNVEASYVTRKLSFELRNPNTHLLIKPNYVG